MTQVLYRHRTWFRWWWPIAGVLVALSTAVMVGALQRLDDLFWLGWAAFLAIGTAVVLLMPWNFVLTTVLVDDSGVHVVKWPGLVRSTIPWNRVERADLVEGDIYRTVWTGRRRVGRSEVRISRRPISVDAYTDEHAVLVVDREGGPALLLTPGRAPEDLAHLINQRAGTASASEGPPR